MGGPADGKGGDHSDAVIPVIDLHDPDDAAISTLRSLQHVILKHPVAAKSLFAALIAEGRKFERTPEGRALRARLERSSLVRQANHLFDMSTLSLLEEQPGEFLPSNYLDVLFMLAGDPDSERILNELFRSADSKS